MSCSSCLSSFFLILIFSVVLTNSAFRRLSSFDLEDEEEQQDEVQESKEELEIIHGSSEEVHEHFQNPDILKISSIVTTHRKLEEEVTTNSSVIEEPPEMTTPVPSDPFVEDLKKYVVSIPLTSFEGDAILLQFSNPLTGRTTYRHLDPMQAMVSHVFETKEDDSIRDVVVLTSYEDNIPVPKGERGKRVFVVLRRAMQLDPRVYFVNYLYIIDAPEESSGIHNFGYRKVFVEWDFFDRREVFDFRAKSLENAFHCSSFILVPCASNETFDIPNPSTRPQNLSSLSYPSYPGTSGKEAETYHVAEGYDSDELMDIYGDMDKIPKVGREISTIPSEVEPPSSYLSSNLKKGRILFLVKNLPVGDNDISNNFGSIIINEVNSVKGMVRKLVGGVVNGIIGWVKNFEGLFGGLGTLEASLNGVGEEIGIEGTDDIFNKETESEQNELASELKQNSAGGLGGMVTGLENEELPLNNFEIDQTKFQVSPAVLKARVLAAMWEPEDDEKPFVQFGWMKTNDVTSTTDVFVGFGACRYHKVDLKVLDAATNEDDLIRVYQKIFKTQCVGYDLEFTKEIIRDGLLKPNYENKTFDLDPEAVHFAIEKLTMKHLKELLRGVQLSLFSHGYTAKIRSKSSSPTTTPDGTTISRSVHTLGQGIIAGTGFIQKNKWLIMRHGFKLRRNIVRSLKIVYQKLSEDKELLGEGDGGFEKELNFNDRVYIMSIIQYIMRGASPVFNGEANTSKTFEDFYTSNKQTLENRVSRQGQNS